MIIASHVVADSQGVVEELLILCSVFGAAAELQVRCYRGKDVFDCLGEFVVLLLIVPF